MNMDDLIFEMNQPNEILSNSEWTEWWVVDETGIYLEYADGWSYEQEYGKDHDFKSETTTDSSRSFYIDVNYEYDQKMKYLQNNYEEAFGKLDENYANNLYTENDIDLFSDNPHKHFPITSSATDYENWPSDYLEYLRDIIDEYNSPDSDWSQDLLKLRAEETISESDVDPEERVVDISSIDGLILPN